MQDPVLRHSFVSLNKSFVHLVQYCRDDSDIIKCQPSGVLLDEKSSSTRTFDLTGSNNPKGNTLGNINTANLDDSLIVFIPGNPGVLGVYHDYLTSLYRAINASKQMSSNFIRILAISHNNFDHPDRVNYRSEERINFEESDLNFVERAIFNKFSNEPHHVELQVLNKLIIIKRLINTGLSNCKLIFVGHSIGCYVILRLLQDKAISSLHVGSIFIHPALENLATTEKGLEIKRMFSYKLDLLLYPLALALDYFVPESVKLIITKWVCSTEFINNSSEIVLESLIQLAHYRSLSALLQMAKSELAVVNNMNPDSMIRPHVDKLRLIYAINDHWVNPDNRRLLQDMYPQLYIEEHPNMHAFVMDPKTVMDYAIKVGSFVQDFIDFDELGKNGCIQTTEL